MKKILLCIVVAVALAGCHNKSAPIKGDVAAGKAIAERDCKACHGLDGKGIAPGIPHLAAQREGYLIASLKEYKEGKRAHAALKDMATQMTEADMRNIAAYYAGQPPIAGATATDVKHSSPYEQGRKLAETCAKCHGEDGNSKVAGTPTLAGQPAHYLVTAIREYHRGERATAVMKSIRRDASSLELENLALYFASQTPLKRTASPRGDPAAGQPASAMCGGCHGHRGVSADAATPSLAGQDADYLTQAIKAYRTTRKHWSMQRYVAGLSDKDIDNIVAYYTRQEPRAAESVPSSTKELADKCNRCHDTVDNPAIVAPKMRGQDKDYLVMALRAYRDDKRESSTMHKMSFAYSNAIIESLALWYASQPAQ